MKPHAILCECQCGDSHSHSFMEHARVLHPLRGPFVSPNLAEHEQGCWELPVGGCGISRLLKLAGAFIAL